MGIEYDTVLDDLQKASILETAADYIILDDDHYTEIWVTPGGSDVTITLPTLADNASRHIKIRNMDGTANVIVDGEGAETINTTTTVEITEKYGWWIFTAGSSEWLGETDGWSTIYYVESETADTGLTVDGTWDDVAGMQLLSGIYGVFYLDAAGLQIVQDTSVPTTLYGQWGLGTISGNNAPNIFGGEYERMLTQLSSQDNLDLEMMRQKYNWKYISDGSVIYMKARANSDELNVTTHTFRGASGTPMYIKARRIA